MNEDRSQPLVSCIIAVFNGETYLQETLDSILAQDYSHIEIIVVNDGSTDGTSEILSRYGNRIHVISQTNQGVSVARNRGVAESSGDLLCFMDADDLMEPTRLTRQVEQFAIDPALEFCDCHSMNFWSPDLSPSVIEADARHAQPFWRNALPGYIISWLFRRSLWDRVGGFTAGMKFSEDFDWISRARDTSMKKLTLPDVLIRRRLHPGNVTAQRKADDMTTLADALMAHLARRRAKKGATP